MTATTALPCGSCGRPAISCDCPFELTLSPCAVRADLTGVGLAAATLSCDCPDCLAVRADAIAAVPALWIG